MGGAEFIFAINMSVAGLLAASFMLIAVYDGNPAAARWLALAYGVGGLNFAIEFVMPALPDARLAVVATVVVLMAAMTFFNAGVAIKYRLRPPWAVLCGISILSVLLNHFIQEWPRQSLERLLAYQAPYIAMQAVGAWIVWRARPRDRLDRALMVLLGLSALHFLAKPFVAYLVGGWGANPQAYSRSTYALVSQSLATVFGMAIALLLLVIMMRSILAEAVTNSVTDKLSGLLNRRGFEEQAARAVNEAVRQQRPVSLVVSDLDRFKSINDSLGHAAGDTVISAFAGFLKQMAAEHHIVGRLGGEEFAVMLPGANLAAARLFAEGARNAFSSLPIAGLPPDRTFTASFGVAELAPGEEVGRLMQRADAALYEAKNGGRDCVRAAPPELAARAETGRPRESCQTPRVKPSQSQ